MLPSFYVLKHRADDLLWQPLRRFSGNHLNFYRVHLIYFTFLPLFAASIFYASNGEEEDQQIPFIDALFMCTSAATVTGLNTITFIRMTRWQQVILFLLMCMGSLTSVSLVTILIRRSFFRAKFERMVQTDPAARRRIEAVEVAQEKAEGKSHRFLHPRRFFQNSSPEDSEDLGGSSSPAQSITPGNSKRKKAKRKLKGFTTDMIHQVDQPGQVQRIIDDLANEKRNADAAEEPDKPNLALDIRGDVLQEADDEEEGEVRQRRGSIRSSPVKKRSSASSGPRFVNSPTDIVEPGTQEIAVDSSSEDESIPARAVKPRARRFSESIPRSKDEAANLKFKRVQTLADPVAHAATARKQPFPHALTIEFADPERDHDHALDTTELRRRPTNIERRRRRASTATAEASFPRTRTSRSGLSRRDIIPLNSRNEGFGGFPNPISVVANLAQKAVGDMSRTLTTQPTQGQRVNNLRRNPTLQRTGTVASTRDMADPKPVNYISFDAIVGRNSRFRSLTSAQEAELGGVEYRALCALWKIVLGYWLGFQFIAVLLAAPYLARSEFNPIFEGERTSSTWYTFFNVWSAYSNLGMSVLDSSMTEFQSTYYWILVLMVLILAGNTAFPIFLRLIIWILCKAAPKDSQFKETCQFLLDHPRRCFLYLFPSYQTWFLAFVLFALNVTDWTAFLVLDIGNEALEALPLGIRFIDGLFQAFAVRAAGFSIVNLADTAPALQVLYVIMMYIAVYPIALSIRSTNVYEERSMGVFEESDDDSDVEAEFDKKPNAGGYIAYHARKQLAFDLWWLVLALFTICIVERNEIEDVTTDYWFNVFTVVFEITSAYGTVGLSLGSPVTGTALAGSFRTLSKLILCAVMLRGRHRGLPIAIDRAVLLPTDMTALETRSDTMSRGSMSKRSRSGSEPWREEPAIPINRDVDGPPPISPAQAQFQSNSLRFTEASHLRRPSRDDEGVQLSDLSSKTGEGSSASLKDA